ncbi:MAG: oligosaccharide flippase family protein [Candidatus Marinimicrobia bacterium]|nr:oligosaccharide flippase family protein [Candidatus Neomarinimicrobiota bacterium]
MNLNFSYIFKDTIKYTITKLIPGIMGLLAVIIFIRMIGPEEYGKYSIQLSFLMAFSAFSIGWLNQSILRYYSKYKTSGFLTRLFGVGVLGSIIFGLVILSIISYFKMVDNFAGPESIIIFVLFAALCVFQFLSTLYRARLKPNNVIVITAVQSILGLLLPVILLNMFGMRHKFLLLGLALSYCTPPIILFLVNINRVKEFWDKEIDIDKSRHVLGEFFKYGTPLSLWFALSLSLPFLDRFFIEYFFEYETTGIYASFTDLVVRVFSILLFPLTLAVHPRIMSAWNNNKQSAAIALWRKALQYQFGLFIVLMAVVYIFSDNIFNVLMVIFPDLNVSYSFLLMPILVGGFLWQFALLCHKPLEMDQRTTLMVVLMLSALCVNLIGNIIYLPQYGIIATAYTYIASAGIYIIFSVYFSRHKFKLAMTQK